MRAIALKHKHLALALALAIALAPVLVLALAVATATLPLLAKAASSDPKRSDKGKTKAARGLTKRELRGLLAYELGIHACKW